MRAFRFGFPGVCLLGHPVADGFSAHKVEYQRYINLLVNSLSQTIIFL